MSKEHDTKGVHECVRDQQGGINSNGLAGGWGVCAIDGRESRDQSGTSKGDTCRNGYLAKEVEPRSS